MFPDFLVNHHTIQQRLAEIDPARYAQSRNHLDGSVTCLSPFITHGIIDTVSVATVVLEKYDGRTAEKLLTELAWREYFQRVWQAHGDEIFTDLSRPQENVLSDMLPKVIESSSTGIDTIDRAITSLQSHGYMHNHSRMWVASVICNVARTHWYKPAQWMYYHLLDGDLASNSLSWQWISGSFSHRKYYANQDNINKYSSNNQFGTFLDTEYEELQTIPIPESLQGRGEVVLENLFPESSTPPMGVEDSTVILHSIWNIDPQWRKGDTGRRILWIETSAHLEFPLSPLRWQFIVHWANQIEGLGLFVGEQEELFPQGIGNHTIIKREHPATDHWPATDTDPRRWCYSQPNGPIKSFSNFWKPIRKSSKFFK